MFTVNDFVFIKPIEEEKYQMIGSLYVPDSAASDKVWRGEIVYSNDYVNESMGVAVGDKVVITDKGRYDMNIMGESLWRMRSDRNILAICEEVQP
jgi:co-chaperonin GroES (HSP10)